MTETSYVKRVHRKLDPLIYRWKINARFSNGVPDAYYSGYLGDLWVEYKYLPKAPVNCFTPALRPLQRIWLSARAAENRNLAVIVGCPLGGIILTNPAAWESPVRVTQDTWLSIGEVVEWIAKQTVCL